LKNAIGDIDKADKMSETKNRERVRECGVEIGFAI